MLNNFLIPPEKSEYDNDLMISGVKNFLGCSFLGLLLTFFKKAKKYNQLFEKNTMKNTY